MEQQLEFTGWVLQVTEKAVLVDVENEAIWIPNSMAEYYGEPIIGSDIEFTIPEWLATKKGLT